MSVNHSDAELTRPQNRSRMEISGPAGPPDEASPLLSGGKFRRRAHCNAEWGERHCPPAACINLAPGLL